MGDVVVVAIVGQEIGIEVTELQGPAKESRTELQNLSQQLSFQVQQEALDISHVAAQEISFQP